MEGKEKMGHMTVEEWESRKQSLTADPNDHTAESGADDRREVWWQGAQPNCRPYILTADPTAWLQTLHPDCRPNSLTADPTSWLQTQHERQRTKCSIQYINILWRTMGDDFTIHAYLSNTSLSESLLYKFLDLSTGGKGPRFHQPATLVWPQPTNWRMEAAFCQEASHQEGTY